MEKLTSKLIIVFFLFLGFAGCKSVEYKVNGFEYISKVILCKDSSFYKYFYHPMFLENHYYGDWKQKGDTILLNIIKPTKVYFIENTSAKVEEFHEGSKDSLYFDIHVLSCSDSYCIISLKEYPNINFDSNKKGIGKILKIPITEFSINSWGCFAGIDYKIKDTTANYFKIKMTAQFENDFKNGNIYTNPTVKYIKKNTKLIPIIHDSIRPDLALKRKLFAKKQY